MAEYKIPEDLRYTKDHEWARLEGNKATVGISDYAQSELSDIVYVELPEVGKRVKMGETLGTIEAVKTVADLYSPLSGKVIEVNTALKDDPSLVNRDPYGEGWMVKLEVSDPGEWDRLMSAEEYKKLISEEG